MNFSSPWLKAAGSTAFVCATLAFGSGCGAVGALSAAANPKVAWALKDPAPMTVVVRRADAAENTAREVDRLLTSTPASDDAQWVAKTAPDAKDATAEATLLGQNPLYVESQARVVPAEVWARMLPAVKADGAQAPLPMPVKVAEAAKPAKPAKAGKPGKTTKESKVAKVVKEEAPPPAPAPAAAPAYASLIAAIDKDLGDKYGLIMGKKKQIADLKSQVANEEAALDQKGITDADKKTHKDKIKELEKQSDQLDGEVSSMAKEFVGSIKATAQKAPPAARDHFGPAFVNLRQAVEDANISNGAAAVRYAIAAPTLVDSTKAMARVYAADIIEEKTGKRPILTSLQPGVTLDGGKVALTLNGLSAADMGKISAGDLTSETVARTQKWVTHALGLLGAIAANKEILGFEQDVLDAMVAGFTAGGWKAPAAPSLPVPAGPGQPAK